MADILDEDVVVLVNGTAVATGRDKILPSYETDFAAGKTVSIGAEPFVAEDQPGVVQVGLISVEPLSEDKTRTTSLTVRYHYNNEGRQTRHEISDISVKYSG